jgi:hypothetical protein
VQGTQNEHSTFFPYIRIQASSGRHSSPSFFTLPFQLPRRQLLLYHVPPDTLHDVVLNLGNHITESSKLTPALISEKIIEPALVDYKGNKALLFVLNVRYPPP